MFHSSVCPSLADDRSNADSVREEDVNVKEQVARIVSNAKGGDMEE